MYSSEIIIIIYIPAVQLAVYIMGMRETPELV